MAIDACLSWFPSTAFRPRNPILPSYCSSTCKARLINRLTARIARVTWNKISSPPKLLSLFLVNTLAMILIQMNGCSSFIGFGDGYGENNTECDPVLYSKFGTSLFSFQYPAFRLDYIFLLILLNIAIHIYYKLINAKKFSALDFLAILIGNITPFLLIIFLSILRGE